MNPAPNLVLVGPMGAGKTSIGKRLAVRLGLAFVDCDHRLEEVTGAAVPLIFECEGEAGFRARETALVADLMRGEGQLVATGGGAVLAPVNREHLKGRGFVVHLQVSVDQQIELWPATGRGPCWRWATSAHAWKRWRSSADRSIGTSPTCPSMPTDWPSPWPPSGWAPCWNSAGSVRR